MRYSNLSALIVALSLSDVTAGGIIQQTGKKGRARKERDREREGKGNEWEGTE